MKTIIAISAAALLSAAGSPVLAQDMAPLKASVSYADLDLSQATGRAVLERRVSGAVARVCPSKPLPTELQKQQTYRECHKVAWTGAQTQLAAIYSGKQLAQASVRVAGK